MQHGDHPRFFARVPGPSSFAGVLGEWLGTGFNAIAASWGGGSGPATVELVALDWLREALGLPEGTEGVLVSGGSMANITAIAAARAHAGPGVAYLSDQTHSSIGRGLARARLRPTGHPHLDSDENLRLPVSDLQRAIAEDRRAGRQPRFVIATAGTTNTGAVDPLPELADLCEREAAVVPRRRRLRRAGRPVRSRPRSARRPGARRLARPRPAQVAVPALRRRLPVHAPRGAGRGVPNGP